MPNKKPPTDEEIARMYIAPGIFWSMTAEQRHKIFASETNEVVVINLGPDCGSNSCRYTKPTGMRTNGHCTCDDCPECGVSIRPTSPQTHHDWCNNKSWQPEHWLALPLE